MGKLVFQSGAYFLIITIGSGSIRGAPLPKKKVMFGTIDPNMDGWSTTFIIHFVTKI